MTEPSIVDNCPQEDNVGAGGRGVSNPGLIFDLHDPQTGEKFFNQLVLFVIQGCPTQMGNAEDIQLIYD